MLDYRRSRLRAAFEPDAQSMVLAVQSRGAATTSPATGTTLTTALVVRTGNATTPQPTRLPAVARISITPSRRLLRKEQVTMSWSLFAGISPNASGSDGLPEPCPSEPFKP